MVMDHLPPPTRIPTIDVCDAVMDGDFLSGKSKLALLDTDFVSYIPGGVYDLIQQFNFSVRGQLGNLFEG